MKVFQDPVTGAYCRGDGKPAHTCPACGNGYANRVALAAHECEGTALSEPACAECGEPIHEDASPGVWLHSSDDAPDGIDHDADADHVALLDAEVGSVTA